MKTPIGRPEQQRRIAILKEILVEKPSPRSLQILRVLEGILNGETQTSIAESVGRRPPAVSVIKKAFAKDPETYLDALEVRIHKGRKLHSNPRVRGPKGIVGISQWAATIEPLKFPAVDMANLFICELFQCAVLMFRGPYFFELEDNGVSLRTGAKQSSAEYSHEPNYEGWSAAASFGNLFESFRSEAGRIEHSL